MKGFLTDVPGIKVGHSHNHEAMTGCTVILTEAGATAGVNVRGSAPGTREIALLAPEKMIKEVHAVLLSGGSAYGLNAATGVMRALEEKEVGFDTGVAKVPIVPSAVLFDLNLGRSDIRPDAKMGYQATIEASQSEIRTGKVGAGMGCSVGKLRGIKSASHSGIGSASYQIADNTYISALIALNAFGDIYDHSGQIIAGCQDKEGNFINTAKQFAQKGISSLGFGENTTLGVVATNAQLSKLEANKLASIAHNGYAKQINPVHTDFDGDTIFVLSTGQKEVDFTQLSILAVKVVSQAIINAIKDPKVL